MTDQQPRQPRSGLISAVRVVGVPVADQDRALAFYVDVLGFGRKRDTAIAGFGRWVEVAPPAGDVSLALITAHEGLPAGVETGVRLGAADVEATHAALAAQGVDVDDVLHWEGAPPMFAFRDPDGNGFEIIP